jgi:hypothetical protein
MHQPLTLIASVDKNTTDRPFPCQARMAPADKSSLLPDANLRGETSQIAAADNAIRFPKDTKPKGFLP